MEDGRKAIRGGEDAHIPLHGMLSPWLWTRRKWSPHQTSGVIYKGYGRINWLIQEIANQVTEKYELNHLKCIGRKLSKYRCRFKNQKRAANDILCVWNKALNNNHYSLNITHLQKENRSKHDKTLIYKIKHNFYTTVN